MMTSKLSPLFSFLIHIAFILAVWNSPFFTPISTPSIIEVQLISAPQKQNVIDPMNKKKSRNNKVPPSSSPHHAIKKDIFKTEKMASSKKESVSDFIPIKTNTLPVYPLICRKRGHEGTVQCIVYINEKGRVTKVNLKKSSNSSFLDQVSIETLMSWRFLSPNKNNTLSLTPKEITFHFRLLSQDVAILSS